MLKNKNIWSRTSLNLIYSSLWCFSGDFFYSIGFYQTIFYKVSFSGHLIIPIRILLWRRDILTSCWNEKTVPLTWDILYFHPCHLWSIDFWQDLSVSWFSKDLFPLFLQFWQETSRESYTFLVKQFIMLKTYIFIYKFRKICKLQKNLYFYIFSG